MGGVWQLVVGTLQLALRLQEGSLYSGGNVCGRSSPFPKLPKGLAQSMGTGME